MKKQFENQEEQTLNNKTDSDVAADERINHLAEKAAKKAATTEQLYDKDNPIFSK